MNFRVGQKVVCVDDASRSFRIIDPNFQRASLGCIYTVSASQVDPWSGVAALMLAELPTHSASGIETWHQAKRFRPLVERKTDISVFTKMLTDTREPVDAR
jgi:hypothetical protein